MHPDMRQALRQHWPEYLMEAAGLGLFMLSACAFTVLLYYPESPVGRSVEPDLLRRLVMGLAMGLTAVALIYSPWGRRSGAHLNPVVTVTFWRLGKIAGWDAAFYVVAQFLGGLGGVLVARTWLGGRVADPAVHYAVTIPGPAGPLLAFGAEIAIAFLLMLVVLVVSNSRGQAFTGLCAGALVAAYITIEAPLSGMSMNPARTLASAVPARTFTALWVYFTAPLIGMFLAADVYLALARGRGAVCAKIYHHPGARCIFRCGYAEGARAEASSPRACSTAVVASVWLVALCVLAAPAVLAQSPAAPPPAVSSVSSAAARVATVGGIGLTVSDMDWSVTFYASALGFETVSDVEVSGPAYEQLSGVFGLRARVVTMQLGGERIELTEYLTPRGRAAPSDSRSNDAWSSTSRSSPTTSSKPTSGCVATRSSTSRPGPSGCRTGTRRRAGSSPSTSGIRTATRSRSSSSRPTRATRAGTGRATASFSGSITPRSWSPTPSAASASTGTRSACAWPGKVRTGGPSKSGSTRSSGPGCASRHCGPMWDPASSCWSI